MVKFQLMKAADYKTSNSAFSILYSFHSTAFGTCLLGVRDNDCAILHLSFADKSKEVALNGLKSLWPYSKFIEDMNKEISKRVQQIFTKDIHTNNDITVLLKGTDFQLKVWLFLTTIPRGTSVTYEDVAEGIGNPKAIRAVGNAVAKNEVAYLVPCHRVKGKSGSDKYAWGTQLKHTFLILEKEQKHIDLPDAQSQEYKREL